MPHVMYMATIEEILTRSKVIAVVGLSDREDRPSHSVARYLQSQGYRIIPVNPRLEGPVLGEKPPAGLGRVAGHIALVDICRRAVDVPPVVESAIGAGASAVWMQLGIINEEAAERAREAGLDVVMDHCTSIEHRLLVGVGRIPRRT